ncbi:hypothetical protein A2U01_0062607, partial [Trifolium medium]|nr:hypothetical protein [Trifolium medium]
DRDRSKQGTEISVRVPPPRIDTSAAVGLPSSLPSLDRRTPGNRHRRSLFLPRRQPLGCLSLSLCF